MGLGKTVQLLALEVAAAGGSRSADAAACARCRWSATGSARRRGSRPGCAVHVHHGGDAADRRQLRDTSRRIDLVLTTYATATRDVDELAEVEWDRVVLDEAQNIKNSRRQAVAGRSGGCRRGTGSR